MKKNVEYLGKGDEVYDDEVNKKLEKLFDQFDEMFHDRMEKHMAKIKLEGERSLVEALRTVDPGAKVDVDGCIKLFAAVGCNNHGLAKKVHDIYAGEGASEGDTVDARAIVCGISLLCAHKEQRGVHL